MGLFGGLWLAVLGVLGASSLIIARRPDAKELIGKLAPYQGWIGAISALWGVWMMISSVLSISVLSVAPIRWVSFLAGGVLQAGLGLILGAGILKSWAKDPTASAKLDDTIAKLSPFQGLMGLAAIGLGLWMVVASILF